MYTGSALGQFILRDQGHPDDALKVYQILRKAKILLVKCLFYNWHIKSKSEIVFLCAACPTHYNPLGLLL